MIEPTVTMLPREKASLYGVGALTDRELLALLIGSGSKQRSVFQIAESVIQQYQFLPSLQQASVADLSQHSGIGPARALLIAASIELGRRCTHQLGQLFGTINSVTEAAHFLMDYFAGVTQEEFVAIYLDAKNAVIAQDVLFKGTLTASIAHPREVFAGALRYAAASVLVAHNHPSGDPDPSEQDRLLTERLVSAGQVIGIAVIDHLIIGREEFVSIRSETPW